MKTLHLFALTLLLGGILGLPMVAGDAIVVANRSVGVDRIDRATLKSLFLGKKKKWDNGSKAVIVVLRQGDVAEAFFKTNVSKTPKQFLTYWKKMVFTGKGSMPRLFESEEELVNYVKMTPGAVGFVQATTATDGVKTLSITP